MSPFANLVGIGLMAWLAVAPARVDSVLALGDRLQKAGLFDEAITEYKRYIFFNSDRQDNEVAYAFGRMAIAYRTQGRLDDATEMFLNAIQAEGDEVRRDDWRVALGVTEMSAGRYDLADFRLLKLEMFSSVAEIRSRAAFLRGVCNLYMGRTDEATKAFQSFTDEGNPEARRLGAEIVKVLSDRRSVQQKSPKVAVRLSTVVPGLGQFYAEDWKNGINALGINFGTIYLVVHDLANRRFGDVFFDSTLLFWRFFSGNREGAAASAERFNSEQGRRMVEMVVRLFGEK